MNPLSPIGRKLLGTALKSQSVPKSVMNQIASEIHR